MKPAVFFLLTAFCAHAGVILNAPAPNSGFFDGTGKVGSISATQNLYGSFAVDTAVAAHFNLAISPNLKDGLPSYVQGDVGSSNGYGHTEYRNGSNSATDVLAVNLASKFSYIIPAGLTLTIPANSIEIIALPSSAEGPEPMTLALTALGIALLIARRLRHPV